METQISPYELRNNLETFTGTEMFYKIPLLNTRFTDGIKYLADTANCFWLVTDTIGNRQKSFEPKPFHYHRFQEAVRRCAGRLGIRSDNRIRRWKREMYWKRTNTILRIFRWKICDYFLWTVRSCYRANTKNQRGRFLRK